MTKFTPLIIFVTLMLALGAEGAILAKPLTAAKISSSTLRQAPSHKSGWRLPRPSKKTKKKAPQSAKPLLLETSKSKGQTFGSVQQKLKDVKEEVAGLNQQHLPSESHYRRIEKDLDWLEAQGVSKTEVAGIRQALTPWSPFAIAETDKTSQAARDAEVKRRATQIDGVLGPESGCTNDRPVLTHDITDFSKIREVTAPGTPTNDRDITKGHAFIWTGGERVPVYVPIAGVLESIDVSPQDGVPHTTFIFRVKGSCSFIFRLAHLTEPDPSLLVGAEVPAGTLVAYTVGNVPSGNWDFGWYDLANNEGPLAQINAFGRHRFGLCWVDYYSSPKQPLYRALLSGPRTVCNY